MFKLLGQTRGGRRGQLSTPHGKLSIPFFMPDATRGFVKLLRQEDWERSGTQALVVNTLHLYFQPGLKIIKAAGGLHRFMGFSGPLLSDSGGYQVFSLIHRSGKMGKISDQGARFKSPLDGSWHELTPEKSIQIQFELGTDMMVCLDDCPPNDFSRPQLEKAVERTVAWAKRSKAEYLKQLKKRRLAPPKRPLLFAVIQGGAEIDLRQDCARRLSDIGFDGYGFGARPVDKSGKFLAKVLAETASAIPPQALRFALGIGTPSDIRRCAEFGWDMFDCVIPTREGRHGRIFRPGKRANTININNARFAKDFRAINAKSRLPELRRHSLAYLHHLFRLDEPLGQALASLNNLEYYQNLMAELARRRQK